jgi:hypothetical protein
LLPRKRDLLIRKLRDATFQESLVIGPGRPPGKIIFTPATPNTPSLPGYSTGPWNTSPFS